MLLSFIFESLSLIIWNELEKCSNKDTLSNYYDTENVNIQFGSSFIIMIIALCLTFLLLIMTIIQFYHARKFIKSIKHAKHNKQKKREKKQKIAPAAVGDASNNNNIDSVIVMEGGTNLNVLQS